MPTTILVVDDDAHIREIVSYALEQAGMQTVEASDGVQALKMLDVSQIKLVILDISMPEMDGLDVCRAIRKSSQLPILFLSSRDEEIDRVVGFEIGGDDYLTKPFSPRELVARVKAILKRAYPVSENTGLDAESPLPLAQADIHIGPLRIEPDKHRVLWDSHNIDLTSTEFSILREMARQPQRVFDRNQIMRMAYSGNIHVSDRTIDSHIRNLRHKFADFGGDNIIQTVHGVGYKLCL